jgi:hypothetical protein
LDGSNFLPWRYRKIVDGIDWQKRISCHSRWGAVTYAVEAPGGRDGYTNLVRLCAKGIGYGHRGSASCNLLHGSQSRAGLFVKYQAHGLSLFLEGSGWERGLIESGGRVGPVITVAGASRWLWKAWMRRPINLRKAASKAAYFRPEWLFATALSISRAGLTFR